jgi:hypothetical protein
MPADRDDPNVRRSLVPPAAGRSLWLASAWTGIGAALVGAVVAIAVVAVCWLPASGVSGNGGSAVRGGLLTFLAALHAGITLDGVPSAFLPLGLTMLAGLIAWRAGAGLADAANELGEEDPGRLARAGAVQAGGFGLACALLAGFATLGTTRVSVVGAALAGVILFAITGGVAFVRFTALADALAERAPSWLAPGVRIAVAVTAVYLAAGAVLVAGAVIVHHDRVEALSHEVGGGWSGVPILLLGVLAAPNAVIAGGSYLAGPGFAVGSGSGVGVDSTVHGTLPAFPVLGALPSGPGATPAGWVLVVLTPILAGCCVAALARRAETWALCWRDAIVGLAGAGLLGGLLAWQGGGGIGTGRLSAVGASPWQLGLAVPIGAGAVAAVVLAALAGIVALRSRQDDDEATQSPLSLVRSTLSGAAGGTKEDKLAG